MHYPRPFSAVPSARDGLHRRRAFTLVEITLALGIASFALLVIFSTMPTGMASLQGAARQIVETEIFNKIGSELATTPWAALGEGAGSPGDTATYTGLFPRYFDAEGNELPKLAGTTTQLSTADSVRKVYTVMFAIPFGTTLWSSGTGTVPGNGDLRWGQVKIYYQFDPNQGTLPAGVKPDTRTFLLSNNGS